MVKLTPYSDRAPQDRPYDRDGAGRELSPHAPPPPGYYGYTPPPFDDPQTEKIDIFKLLRSILIRKWLVISIILIGVISAAGYTLWQVPQYRSSVTIEILKKDDSIIEGVGIGQDNVADATFMATQYELLRSRALAERVAEVLDLPSDARYANQDAKRSRRLEAATQAVLFGSGVAPVRRSRVIEISYTSIHPSEASRIANAIAENFIESNMERKYNATAYARRFLEERLASTKRLLEDSQRKLVAYAQDKGIIELGAEGAPSLDASSLIALNDALAQAQSERISAEQTYREAVSNPLTREFIGDEVLAPVKERRSKLVAEYEENLSLFKPDYPDMLKLSARIQSLDREIEATKNGLVGSLETAYRAALGREQSLQSRVDGLKEEVQDLRNRRIEYEILQREVDTTRSQYEALLQRLKEVSFASGVANSQVSIVDRAVPPTRPFSPNLKLNVAIGFAASLLIGVGLALVLGFFDDTIKTPEDVEEKLGLPTFGVIPKQAEDEEFTDLLRDPRSPVSEAFSSAKTALEFATTEGLPKSILVTSTRPAEGKTSTAIALATALSKSGRRTLIIDADMRRPSFMAGDGDSIGLSGLLTSADSLSEHVVGSDEWGLHLIPSGVIPPNPAELLSGKRLRDIIQEAEQWFDVVIVDAPPVMSFADSPLLASACRGVIVVVQSGGIRAPAAARTIGRLSETRSTVLGVILTKFDAKKAGYGYGYGYGYYEEYGYGDEDADGNLAIADESTEKRRINIFAVESHEDDDQDVEPRV